MLGSEVGKDLPFSWRAQGIEKLPTNMQSFPELTEIDVSIILIQSSLYSHNYPSQSLNLTCVSQTGTAQSFL